MINYILIVKINYTCINSVRHIRTYFTRHNSTYPKQINNLGVAIAKSY